MSRKLLPILGFGLLATLLAVVGLVTAPERRDLILDLYVLALGGIAVIRLVGLTRRRRQPGEHSEFDDALNDAPAAVRIAERDKLAREVQLGMQTAFDLHYRLRPTLVEIARNRLAGRGVTLESERAAAPARRRGVGAPPARAPSAAEPERARDPRTTTSPASSAHLRGSSAPPSNTPLPGTWDGARSSASAAI